MKVEGATALSGVHCSTNTTYSMCFRVFQTVKWSDRVPERDSIKPCVYDMCYRPDGSQLVVAVGNRVLIYDANDGDLVHSLKGHKDTVCL